MSIVPNNATLCGGPGPHAGLGGSVASPCPRCGGQGWYVDHEFAARARWSAFTDEEIRTLLREMTEDDGIVYGFTEDDEPAYSLWRQLVAQSERRGIAR